MARPPGRVAQACPRVADINITRHLCGVVQKDTLLISDGEKAYQNVNAYACVLKT